MNYFLSIDIGTTSIKAALFNSDSTLLSHSSINLQIYKNSKDWNKGFVKNVSDVISMVLSNVENVSCDSLYICISGNGPSIVCADETDIIVNFTSWQDEDKKICIQNTSSYFLPQVEYLKQNKPQVFSKIAWVLPPAEYLGFLMCGKKSIWIPHNDYLKYMWTKKDIKTYDMQHIFFAPPQRSGSIVGNANTNIAQKIIAKKFQNTYVVAGGLDYLSAFIGSDVQKNEVFQRSGTSVVLNIAVETDSHILKSLPTNYTDKEISHFILPHVQENYLNIGFAVPYFQYLYKKIYETNKDINLTSVYEQKLFSHFSQTITNNAFSAMNENSLDSFLAQNIANEKQSAFLLHLLLCSLEKTFKQILRIANIEEYTNNFIISGGHAYDAQLVELISKKLCVNTKTFIPAHCELLGNLKLAQRAAGLN